MWDGAVAGSAPSRDRQRDQSCLVTSRISARAVSQSCASCLPEVSLDSSARVFVTKCVTFLWRQVRSCSATHASMYLQACMFDTVRQLTSSFNLCCDRFVCIRRHNAGGHLQALIFDLGVSRGANRAVQPSGMIIATDRSEDKCRRGTGSNPGVRTPISMTCTEREDDGKTVRCL